MSKARRLDENPYSPDRLRAFIVEAAQNKSYAWAEVWQTMVDDSWLRAEVVLRAKRFAKSSGLNAQISDDIADEVLLLLAAKLATEQVMHANAELLSETFLAWMGTILDRACSEAARKLGEYRWPRATVLHDVLKSDDAVLDLNRIWDLADAVARLEGRQRSVMLLFLRGLDRQEIAQTLGLHYKQVVYAIDQAKPKLQRWLSAYDE
jgi:DNA-directed RNA polymerase specialized sigma24 family protein